MNEAVDSSGLYGNALVVLFFGGAVWAFFFLPQFFRKGRVANESRAMVLPWRLSWTDFGIFAWLVLMWIWVVQLLVAKLLPPPTESLQSEIWTSVGGGILMQTGLALVFLVFYQFSPFFSRAKLSTRELGLSRAFFLGLGFYLAFFPLILGLNYLWSMLAYELVTRWDLPIPLETQRIVSYFTDAESPLLLVLLIVMAVVAAPIGEELVFRAGVYRFLKSRTSREWAMLWSGTLFALLHINFLSFPPLLLVGVLLCVAYEWTGSIRVPIFFHGCFNLTTIILVLIQPAV